MVSPDASAEQIARALRQGWSSSGSQWGTTSLGNLWQMTVQSGATGWNIPAPWSHTSAEAADSLLGSLELARGSLEVAFLLSQFHAATARLVASPNRPLQDRWLPDLAAGRLFTTVGISHLTTSGRHHRQPLMRMEAVDGGWRLNGLLPWVSGACRADVFLMGAQDAQGQPWLFMIPADRTGVAAKPPFVMLALNDTQTAAVEIRDVLVTEEDVVMSPSHPAVTSTKGLGTGSLTTSALALGHAWQAIDRLEQETTPRPELLPVWSRLNEEATQLRCELKTAATQTAVTQSLATPQQAEDLRSRCTSLALRSAQTYLAATKGAGFVAGHPAERLVREAQFFLVWSCPPGVVAQLMDEFSRCPAL